MDGLREYLLTVVAAAIISGIAVNLLGRKGLHRTIIKLLSGLFLSITVISPITKIHIENITTYLSGLQVDAATIISEAEKDVSAAQTQIIKQQVEAYILDEASKLGLTLEATVTFSDDLPLMPKAVSIRGTASPYNKQRLQKIIANDLGIPEEQQMWK